MKSEKFFNSKSALVTLLAACFVVLISLGVRQTFGLFFIDFNESLKISNTAFGFAIGVQMLMWGLTGPIFGAIADRYGGHVAIISAFIFYTLGILGLFSFLLSFISFIYMFYLKFEQNKSFVETPMPLIFIFFTLSGFIFFSMNLVLETFKKISNNFSKDKKNYKKIND